MASFEYFTKIIKLKVNFLIISIIHLLLTDLLTKKIAFALDAH